MNKPIYAGMTKPEGIKIEDGEYPAICFQIIQIGSQRFEKEGREWFSPQVLLGFEIPSLTYETKSGVVSAIKSGTYFLSLNPSRNGTIGLREIIDGFRGNSEWSEEELEKFNISDILGKPCLITVAEVESKGKSYSNITAVAPFVGEGMLAGLREPVLITVEDFGNGDLLGTLPNWIQVKIQASKEYREMQLNQGIPALPNDTSDETLGFDMKDESEIRIEDVPF